MSRLLFTVVTLLAVGSVHAEEKPFLKQEKSVPAGKEWNREIVANNAGTISIRIKGNAPYSITLITDAAYKAVNSGGEPKREDLLFTTDSNKEAFEKQ